MANIVRAWSSKITHITDGDPNGEFIITRCGRKLKTFQFGYGGERECDRCGTSDDYDQIHKENTEAWHKKRQLEKEQREAQEELNAARLENHRHLMKEFSYMLQELGASITYEREYEAGGRIEFEIGELKFKITGNIW